MPQQPALLQQTDLGGRLGAFVAQILHVQPGHVVRKPGGGRDAPQIHGGAQGTALRIDLEPRLVDGCDDAEGIRRRMGVTGCERIPHDHSSAGLQIVHFWPSSAKLMPSHPMTRTSRSGTGVGGAVRCNANHLRPVATGIGRRRIVGCICAPSVRLSRTYIIAQPCVDLKDKACIDECPVDCIYEGERSLYIHPDECVDCGACEPVCPVEAIFYEDDVPDEWEDYYKANVEFFDDLGSPVG
ncbi:NAD-dependent dihydropyrimidine dehydrogenase, PreA subunit, partial [Brevibacterium aurantiacum]